jgi:hypothetical protein
LLAVAWTLTGAQGLSQAPLTLRESFWRTDGPVRAVLVTNDVVYVGGRFSYVGRATGGVGKFALDAARADARLPAVLGTGVLAAVSDGVGGWYLGGSFTNVGGLTRSNLARLRVDGTVDPAWDPGADGPVLTLALTNQTLYVGGAFTQISGQARSGVAALNATTASAGSWNPNATDVVRVIVPAGRTVYVGGNFAFVGGQPRNRLAALDAETGLATSWDPNAGGEGAAVACLQVVERTVYVGGTFTSVGGKPRNRLAALETNSGAATDWNPNANGPVFALGTSGTTVYVGGQFTSIGAENRSRLAALDGLTGRALPWAPSPDAEVNVLAVQGDAVYLGGGFTSIGGVPRSYLAAVDRVTGRATAWYPALSMLGSTARPATVCLAFAGTEVLAGGTFASAGGARRSNAAAVHVRTGEATAWDPSCQGTVNALAVHSNLVYVAGAFTHVGGQSRNLVAAVDLLGGAVTEWNPNLTGPTNSAVLAMGFSGNRLLLGGLFTAVGGSDRSSLAAVRLDDGRATAWNPAPTVVGSPAPPTVAALQIVDDTAYVGGLFDSIGGRLRARLASLSLTTGLADPWDPAPDAPVNTLAIVGGQLYAGGSFTRIGGRARNRVCALDLGTGAATDWNPDADGTGAVVLALASAGNSLLIGGQFASAGGEFRNRLAGIRRDDGQADSWNPDLNAPVRALAAGTEAYYVGGEFTSVGQRAAAYLAVFSREAFFLTDSLRGSPGGPFTFRAQAAEGQRLLIQGSTDLIQWTNLGTQVAPREPFVWADPQASTLPQRFYRLEQVPDR